MPYDLPMMDFEVDKQAYKIKDFTGSIISLFL